jgi:tRNA nucleotidyltransferase/poly(A) polymerase
MSLLDMKLHHIKDISKGRDTKGDEQKVEMGITIEDDVKRRDLTVNALFSIL